MQLYNLEKNFKILSMSFKVLICLNFRKKILKIFFNKNKINIHGINILHSSYIYKYILYILKYSFISISKKKKFFKKLLQKNLGTNNFF